MIESIQVANAASYGPNPEQMAGLAKLNYVYGANGSGKTTLSRIIADEGRYPGCQVRWRGGQRMETRVYNADFVDRSFTQQTELKGVFTLGEEQAETLARIAETKASIEELTGKIDKYSLALGGADGTGGKLAEVTVLENDFKNKCWEQKVAHDEVFQGAFAGVRNNAEKFKARVLLEQSTNKANLEAYDDLVRRAQTLFGSEPTSTAAIALPDFARLLEDESNTILAKVVIGKDDVDIAAMIKRLGNSDWVRLGRPYFEINQNICPFCQQPTDDGFARSLAEYFDEVFVADIRAIEALGTQYASDSTLLLRSLDQVLESPSDFLDSAGFEAQRDLLKALLKVNQDRLTDKKREPSRIVQLESLSGVGATIGEQLQEANQRITEHNAMVANLGKEQSRLTSAVWRFVLEELKADLTLYVTAKDSLQKAITSLRAQIDSYTGERTTKINELRALEKLTTSVQPTIDAINGVLVSFGFRGFRLAPSPTGRAYRIVRSDDSDAKTSLSEGERTFITFLYFYHQLKGSESETGVTAEQVVVIDDPVSSLDSEVLFVVSSLIKGLFDEVRQGSGPIRQVFVLTHNVYFHKEVTYNSRRRGAALADETFWTVRKPEMLSVLQRHETNPIKTSYDLLWDEVRRPDRSVLTIQNTLRRILENYFKILGGINLDQVYEKFEGQERLICKSLVSWVNDGSHFAQDDLFVTIEVGQVDTYLAVFRAVFEKTDQIQHYNMMMRVS